MEATVTERLGDIRPYKGIIFSDLVSRPSHIATSVTQELIIHTLLIVSYTHAPVKNTFPVFSIIIRRRLSSEGTKDFELLQHVQAQQHGLQDKQSVRDNLLVQWYLQTIVSAWAAQSDMPFDPSPFQYFLNGRKSYFLG